MTDEIFKPMGLQHTSSSPTPEIPSPVLHTFSSERRESLKIPVGVPFYEESTYWNPSWTVPEGAIQTQDIGDLTTSIAAIGSGKLLSPASYEQQTGALLKGFGRPQDGCPACRTNTDKVTFAMGLIRQGPWITGNKFYAGSGAVFGYEPAAWDDDGAMSDAGPPLFREFSAAVDPGHPLP